MPADKPDIIEHKAQIIAEERRPGIIVFQHDGTGVILFLQEREHFTCQAIPAGERP